MRTCVAPPNSYPVGQTGYSQYSQPIPKAGIGGSPRFAAFRDGISITRVAFCPTRPRHQLQYFQV
jgi:hypothetical protein